MSWLGLDIGGANLKLADGAGFALSRPFALWRKPEQLAQSLRSLIVEAPQSDRLAVTMTGELADCFESKTQGVEFILNAVQDASDGRHTRIYLTSGRLVTPQVAARKPLEAAASNWHALARFVGQLAPQGFALLIDVGSTTTDVIPLLDGQPAPSGTTDTARLLSQELIYLGAERTPVCAIVDVVPYRGESCPVARELFATTRDAYLILGDLREERTATDTADGRPATKSAARQRLRRMICADVDQFNHRDAVAISQAITNMHLDRLATGIQRVVDRHQQNLRAVVIAGVGEFLARQALQKLQLNPRAVLLSQELGVAVSRCAPAHAVAILAREAAMQ